MSKWLGPELVSNLEIPDNSTPKPWEGLTGKVWDHSESEMVYVRAYKWREGHFHVRLKTEITWTLPDLGNLA